MEQIVVAADAPADRPRGADAAARLAVAWAPGGKG
jgi:uncharacterized protein (DUF2126 family)